jgi:hypothetical protein
MDAGMAGRAYGAHADASQRGGKGIEADRDDLARAFWRKSTHSYGNSKDKAGPVLLFSSSEWSTFVGAVKNGEFDLLQ